MSVEKWRYTEDCDYRPCPGDCDLCPENDEDEDEVYTVTEPTVSVRGE